MKDKSQLYEECKRRYKLKELTSRKAAELCQISQATFLQWIKQDENYNPDEIVKLLVSAPYGRKEAFQHMI